MLEDIMDNIETDIDDIKNLRNVPDGEKFEVLNKLREISDTLNDWLDEYGDEEAEDDYSDGYDDENEDDLM